MAQKEVKVWPTQMEFINSINDMTLFCGGIRSGKTHAGALWACMMVLKYPDCAGLITANSYSQIQKATVQKFLEVARMLGLNPRYSSQNGIITINNTQIYTISMEKYDLLRGIEVGWAWSDECAFYREEAFDVLIGRISDARGPGLWKGTTTPNGFNWLYKRFVSETKGSTKVIYAKSADNSANLKSGYIENLMSQYDSRRVKQELEGSFINMSTGRVYYEFDRYLHVKEHNQFDDLYYVGLDFNVNPMTGVYLAYKNGVFYVTDELYQKNSNTFAAAKEILEKHSYYKVQVIADSTGSKRQTSARYSDHEILKRANLEVVKFTNPSIKDRYNNINRLLHHGRLVIDPKCKNLIIDLEQLTYDNQDPMLSHISDALGYVCWHLDALKPANRAPSISYY